MGQRLILFKAKIKLIKSKSYNRDLNCYDSLYIHCSHRKFHACQFENRDANILPADFLFGNNYPLC